MSFVNRRREESLLEEEEGFNYGEFYAGLAACETCMNNLNFFNFLKGLSVFLSVLCVFLCV